jgi:hypothetical protein
MEEKSYSDCELRYIREEGYEPSQAAEICAQEEGRGEDTEGSGRDVGDDYFWE